ncbi:bifunctional 4-hydroxy-3-methylbut-2-enyl diphosphate reductase/30S ribosomal protein S1 [Proteinivorax tanatarense]|uniref:4-hydroxy-3-methylbut-2-enyl diphosphate reductase n=1 Tax=Proteinivorax tanatarense TaxID=1260629 RepID=A0AAU7VHQ4_9FIRM
MEIKVAKHSGFCKGVKDAVKLAESNSKDETYTLGPLVHNPDVIDYFEKRGVYQKNDPLQIKDSKVILRSHGVGPNIIEILKNNNNKIIDGTCPFVGRVQKLVNEMNKEKIPVLIMGDEKHPEIIGIKQWAEDTAIIINKEEQARNIDIKPPFGVVAQTTFSIDKFKTMLEILKEKYHKEEIIIHNTICAATELRQKSVKELALEVDLMLVIGGENSSNTAKLKDICIQSGVKTYLIQNYKDINPLWFDDAKVVGIAAGASTPEWSIKEVYSMVKEIETKELEVGKELEGEIVKVTDEEVLVSIGDKAEATLPKNEFSLLKVDNLQEVAKEGDKVKVIIKDIDDDGNVILSKRQYDDIHVWEKLEQDLENKAVLTGKVLEEVKGGITIDVGARGFMPASLIDTNYIEDLSTLVGEELEFIVKELDKEKNKIILSRKDLLLAEKAKNEEKALEKIEPGQRITGTVRRITDFGAFVDIGGVDGLVHVSNISWSRVKHPSDVLEVGQQVEVEVLDVKPEEKRIGLSIKATQKSPYDQAMEKLNVGDIVDGKVVRLTGFGAFVEVVDGVDGLVHISQISEEHISNPSEILEVGQEVKVKILDVKPEEKRVSLSIKEAQPKENFDEYAETENLEVNLGERFKDLFDKKK